MAVTAVDAVITDVMLMAELHRLAARHTDLRHVGGAVNRGESGDEDDDDTDAPENAHPGDGVRAPDEISEPSTYSYFSLSYQLSKIIIVV